MSLPPAQVDWRSLYAALPEGAERRSWQVVHIAPVRLTVEGGGNLRRLDVGVDLYLLRSGNTAANRVHTTLRSDAWTQASVLPPAQRPVQLCAAVAEGIDTPLPYTLCDATPRQLDGNPTWLQYLQPARVPATTLDEELPALPLEQSLPQALSLWLSASLKAATVGEAIRTAQHGPLGHHGPVESIVLERSGEADLAVDVTRLGEVDDATEQGDDATTRLQLYGERFGLWLLHRRVSRRAKPQNKRLPPDTTVQEVLIAETAGDLMQRAGLGLLEKRLFQQAGLLPHATLWQSTRDDDTEDAAATETAQSLDIGAVADRSRRQLQNLVALAQQGKLKQADIDLLFRLARQLSRAR